MKIGDIAHCVNCNKKCRLYRHFLCWKCGQIQEVRDKFKVYSKYSKTGSGLSGVESWDGWHPTEAKPGSYRKMAVMRIRAGLGQPLHHPRDAVGENDANPQERDIIRGLTSLTEDVIVEIQMARNVGESRRSVAMRLHLSYKTVCQVYAAS